MRTLALASLVCLVAASARGYQDPKVVGGIAEEVVLMPIGPFGEALSGCRLDEFLTRENGRPVDRRGRFTGLVGKKIPFGTYVVSLTCDVPKGVTSISHGVASTRVVRANKEFLVISSHRWLGDYGPSGGPRLRVNVLNSVDMMWIKMVGLYLESVQIAGVDQASAYAQIVAAAPGDYLVLLMKPDGVVCERTIRLLDPSGFMTIDAGNACAIIKASGVEDLPMSTRSKVPSAIQ